MARMKPKSIVCLCFVLLIFFGASLANAQPAQEIAKRAFRSTAILVMEDANGQPLSLGSGFLVRDGQVASNLHVVAGATRGYAKLIGEKAKYDIEGITAVDSERDLVVLRISARRTQVLPLGNSDVVQVGEPVYAVGNPQGLEGTFSQGIVSSVRDVGTDKLLQITAPISPGSSGGPVLNARGEVIGVSVATYRGGQNLNFAIPSNYLKALLSKTGPVKPLAQVEPNKSQKSIMSGLGGRSTEGVVGTSFIWSNPLCFNCGGSYTFSLNNQLRDAIRNVYCLLIFYDSAARVIDVDIIRYKDLIPGGLAKRIKSSVDPSVQQLTETDHSGNPKNRVECRILDFQAVN